MRVSIIISTYHTPIWLEEVLWGYSVQDDMDFEIIIADDGSNPANRRTIKSMIQCFDYPVYYLWQPDAGFRKTQILNKAINAGVRGKQIRYAAICIHLDHDRGYATPEGVQFNQHVRQATRRSMCPHGQTMGCYS